MKDKLYTVFVTVVCVVVPLLVGWGFLVLLGKLVTAWGWW
jgi:hypothetical protein